MSTTTAVPMARSQKQTVLLPAVTDLDRAVAQCGLALKALDSGTAEMLACGHQDTLFLDVAAEKTQQAKRLLDEAGDLVRKTALS